MCATDFMHHPLIAPYTDRHTPSFVLKLTRYCSKSNKKKRTANATAPTSGSFQYHPEEEMIDARAAAVHAYALKTAQPRDDESFGVEQFGRLVLVETGKLAEAVGAMEDACKP
jgi:hypothetical protein